MRTIAGWILACGVVLAAVPNTFAGEHEDALAIVEQAIKAHGGADALNKAQTMTRMGAGTMTLFGNNASSFTEEAMWSLPGRSRSTVVLDKKLTVTTVVNGDKGWQSAGGPAMELGAERLRELRDEVNVLWLATLTPLKKDDFKLAPLPDIKVNGEPAVGIKATSKDRPEVKLYFDKKTHLLVKIERRASEAGLKVDKEYLYTVHKEFDGVKLPTKEIIQLSGRKFSELNITAYKLLNKIDDAAFAKP